MDTIWKEVPTIFNELTGVEWPTFQSRNPDKLSADLWEAWKHDQSNNIKILAEAIDLRYRSSSGDFSEIWIDLVKVKMPKTAKSFRPLRALYMLCAFIDYNLGTPAGQRIQSGSMQHPGEIFTRPGAIDTLLEDCNNFITENIP
jgi:hypothetical protein